MDAQSLLRRLSEKYESPLPLLEALERRYGAIRPDVTPGREFVRVPDRRDEYAPENPLVFTDDASQNQVALARIMRGYADMAAGILSMVGERRGTYEKLLNQYAEKTEKLLRTGKNAEKLAGGFQKILRQTLLKLWSSDTRDSPVNGCLRRYFRDCGIRSRDYQTGRRLSNDDLTYLDTEMTQAYAKPTTSTGKNYEVIQMIRPILFIGYQEDGEEAQETFVEGICSYSYFARERRTEGML